MLEQYRSIPLNAAVVEYLKPDPRPALHPSAPGGALAGLPAGQPTIPTSGVRSEQGKARGRMERR